MSKLKVYLSSPFMEFEDTRKKFLEEIQARAYLYDVNAMEIYRAEDVDVLEKCIKDVNECHIYVCILGSKYGTPAKENKSYTHWEYITAFERKARGENVERIILLNREAPTDPNLVNWINDIQDSKILPAYYKSQDEIPQIILESLDTYTRKMVMSVLQKKDVVQEKIYLCNRSEQDEAFITGINDDPVQFFLLYGHDNDRPHYFTRRKELEFEDMSTSWHNINITPSIPDDINKFESVEFKIKAAIFSKLKWKKFKQLKDVTITGLIDYMTESRFDYLSITWFIESAYWRDDKLNEFIVSFYDRYNKINPELKTDKRIIFFGILSYVDNDLITEEEFNKKVQKIIWENNLPKLGKIKKKHIKDWLMENDFEQLDYQCEQLISLYLKEINNRDLYFSEAEGGLLDIIKLYKQEHFK